MFIKTLIIVSLSSALGLRLPSNEINGQKEGNDMNLKSDARLVEEHSAQWQTAEDMRLALDKDIVASTPHKPFNVALGRVFSSGKPANPFNDAIGKAFSSGKPTLVGRLSCGAETKIMTLAAQGKHVVPKEKYHTLSGIYPITEKGMSEFVKTWKDALSSFGSQDLMSQSCNEDSERFVVNKFTSGATINSTYTMKGMEPFWWSNPWTSVLKGKTVLIIHAFIDTIRCQMKRRETLFEDPNVLPDMELKYIKTVQALGTTPHASWKESLQSMFREIDNIGHFDVAIISGGAFGMPLAAYVKEKKNASAIMMGGASQLLFGVKGSRWSSRQDYHGHFLDTWIYPLRNDTPENYKTVEDGCYWAPNEQEILEQCPA